MQERIANIWFHGVFKDTEDIGACGCPDACVRKSYGYDISYTSFSQLSMGALLNDVNNVTTSYQHAVNTAHRYFTYIQCSYTYTYLHTHMHT